MTTVVAKRIDGGVVFAHDTQVTGGNEIIPGIDKVFGNGPVVFGFAGNVRVLNILQHGFNAPKFKKRDALNPEGYIIGRLVPAIQKALEGHKALDDFKGVSSARMSTIVAVGGTVGYLDSDFSFCGHELGQWAVGSGGQFAQGALAHGATVREALNTAMGLDAYTGGDVIVKEVAW